MYDGTMTTKPLPDATVRECATDYNSRLEGGTEAFDEWLAGVRADVMDGAARAIADLHRELATVKQQRSDNFRAIESLELELAESQRLAASNHRAYLQAINAEIRP